MMLKAFLLVGLGGACGSMARYAVSLLTTRGWPGFFPYGTFAVNVLGCLLIGVVYGLAVRTAWLTPEWRLLLATGFCGGFTTFSAFAYENVALLQAGERGMVGWYVGLSVVVGTGAVAIGMWVARSI